MPPSTLLALAMTCLADPPSPLDVASAVERATVEAIAKARPSVVAITRVRGEEPDKTTAIRGMPDRAAVGTSRVRDDGGLVPGSPGDYAAPGDFSSGVVVGEGGEILTTYHSLRGAARIWVRADRLPEFEAEILAADPRSDLAVIAPREGAGTPPPRLTPMALGDATGLRPGTSLMALGNSYNAGRDGRASAAAGILSNTARKVHSPPADQPSRNQFFRFQPTLLQLDAKLNMGMSGGAVVNLKGELVGLTTAAASPVAYDMQAGYAVPIDRLGRRIVETLKQGKEVEYGFLGVVLHEFIPNGVRDVQAGTPAALANIVVDDVIVAVGDRALDEDDGLTMALANVPPGRTVGLKLRRQGRLVETNVLVSKYPIVGVPIMTNRPRPWRGVRVDFTSALPSAGGLGARNVMDDMALGNVGVAEVEPGSPADLAGLKRGEVIVEVDDRPVITPEDFLKAVSARDGRDVTLTTRFGQVGFGQVQTSDRKLVIKK